MHKRQHALHNDVELLWMLDDLGWGVDEHIGSFYYSMA